MINWLKNHKSRQFGNTSDAVWWPKLELMQVQIEEEEKVEKKFRKNGERKS